MSITTTENTTSFTQGGALTIAGGVGIAKTLNVGTGINTPNVNLGISSIYSSSFIAANNTSTPTNVVGLSFDINNIRYFEAKLVITITRTDTTTINEITTLRGNYIDLGWQFFTESIGNISGITFTITGDGQVQYTSSNITNFSNSIFRFSVQQYTKSGTYTSIPVTTTGNYLMNSAQFTSTQNAIYGTSVGALQVLGGVTIEKNLIVKGNTYGIPQFAIFEEQLSNGTASVYSTTGSYITRVLNTVISNTVTALTLNSNQITISAGTYKFEVITPLYDCGRSKARLRNITDSSTIALGTNAYSSSASALTYSHLHTIFTSSSTKIIEVQQYFELNTSNQNGGIASSFGDVEVYARVIITKLL